MQQWSYEGPEGVKNEFTLWSSIHVDARGFTIQQFIDYMKAQHHMSLDSISILDVSNVLWNFLKSMKDKAFKSRLFSATLLSLSLFSLTDTYTSRLQLHRLAEVIEEKAAASHLKLDKSGVEEFTVVAPLSRVFVFDALLTEPESL